MKKAILAMVLLMGATTTFAQESVVKEAKSLKGKPEQAAQKIEAALTNAETKDDPATWKLAGDFQFSIYEGESQKIYLQSINPNDKADMPKMYNSLLKMIEYYTTCDDKEVAMMKSNPKYKKLKFREKNAELIKPRRGNLINGGVDAINAQKYDEALKYFGAYVDLSNAPMFEKDASVKADTMVTLSAAYAAMAANFAEDKESMLKYGEIGKLDPNEGWRPLMYMSEYYKTLPDTAKWVEVLDEGVKRFPQQDYFVGNLADYYLTHNKTTEGIAMIDEMLKIKQSAYYYFVKGVLQLESKDYTSAVATLQNIIDLNDTMLPQAYSKIGDCYLFPAQDIATEISALAVDDPKYAPKEAEVKDLYRKAMPYYEKAKELAPTETKLWQFLANIYWVLGDSKYEAIAKELGIE